MRKERQIFENALILIFKEKIKDLDSIRDIAEELYQVKDIENNPEYSYDFSVTSHLDENLSLEERQKKLVDTKYRMIKEEVLQRYQLRIADKVCFLYDICYNLPLKLRSIIRIFDLDLEAYKVRISPDQKKILDSIKSSAFLAKDPSVFSKLFLYQLNKFLQHLGVESNLKSLHLLCGDLHREVSHEILIGFDSSDFKHNQAGGNLFKRISRFEDSKKVKDDNFLNLMIDIDIDRLVNEVSWFDLRSIENDVSFDQLYGKYYKNPVLQELVRLMGF